MNNKVPLLYYDHSKRNIIYQSVKLLLTCTAEFYFRKDKQWTIKDRRLCNSLCDKLIWRYRSRIMFRHRVVSYNWKYGLSATKQKWSRNHEIEACPSIYTNKGVSFYEADFVNPCPLHVWRYRIAEVRSYRFEPARKNTTRERFLSIRLGTARSKRTKNKRK